MEELEQKYRRVVGTAALPESWQPVIALFSAVDAAVSFLLRKHLACSLKNVAGVANADHRCHNLQLTEESLGLLAAISPPGLLFVRPRIAETHAPSSSLPGSVAAAASLSPARQDFARFIFHHGNTSTPPRLLKSAATSPSGVVSGAAEISPRANASQLPSLDIELEPSGSSKARRTKRIRLFLSGCLSKIDSFHRRWLLRLPTGVAGMDAANKQADSGAVHDLVIERKVLLKWHEKFPISAVPLPEPIQFDKFVPIKESGLSPAAQQPLAFGPNSPQNADSQEAGGFVRALDSAAAVREHRSRIAASGVGLLRSASAAPSSGCPSTAGGTNACRYSNVEEWLKEHIPAYVNQLVHVHETPSAPSERQALLPPLPPELHNALQRRGITQLYTHQVQGIQAARRGDHVVIATSTSSGKSLIFNLPVLERLLRNPSAVALFMFPTKALAQDQLRALNELLATAEGANAEHSTVSSKPLPLLGGAIRPAVFDGDSTQIERRNALKNANIILCNPDILHVTLLPHHSRWSRLLRNLAVVVLDEAHVYSGVFGAHVALTLRRLRRVAMLYGARIQFIAASATIGNPAHLVRTLIGESPFLAAARMEKDEMAAALAEAEDQIVVVDQDTSGAGRRKFLVWNPPLLSELMAARAADEASFRKEMVAAAAATGDIHAALAVAASQLSRSMASPTGCSSTGSGSEDAALPEHNDTAARSSRKRQRSKAQTTSDAQNSSSGSALAKRPRSRRRNDALKRVRSLAREAGQAIEAELQSGDSHKDDQYRQLNAPPQLRVTHGALSSFDSGEITSAAARLLPQTAQATTDGRSQAKAGRTTGASSQHEKASQHARTSAQAFEAVRAAGAATMAELRALWASGQHASIAADLLPLPPVDLKDAAAITARDELASGSHDAAVQGAHLGVSLAPPPGWQDKWKARAELLYPPRRSAIVEGALVIAALIAGGMKTICFTRVRHVAELLLQYVQERLAKIAPWAVPLVKSYRGGYLKEHRRQIEREMFAGRLCGIVATNALELGIDIGALDSVVLVGYPGSISSLWQQSGRAGRGRKDAVTVLVTFDSPTDQFYARHPDLLATSSPEDVHVDLSNVNILRQQLVCAAGEVPLSPADIGVFGSSIGGVMRDLKTSGLLVPAPSHWRELLSTGNFPQPQPQAETNSAPVTSLEAASGAASQLVEARVQSDTVASRRTWAASRAAVANPEAATASIPPSQQRQHQVVRVLPTGAVPVHIGSSAPVHKRLFSGLLHARGAGYLLLNTADERGVISTVDSPLPRATGSSSQNASSDPPGPAVVRAAVRAWALAPWIEQPARNVSMRAIDDVQYEVLDAGAGDALVDTVDEWRAYFCIHPGAIYMQQGVTYKVEQLDTTKHIARVRVANVPYYTATRDHTDITVLGRLSSKLGRRAFYGRLSLSLETFGYKKIWKQGGGVFEVVDMSLPAVNYQTFGVWLDVPLHMKHELDARGLDCLAGMHAANHAIVGVLPMFVKCERSDLGCECPSALQQRAKPMRCMFYDKRPGGTGIVAAAFSKLEAILKAAITLCMDCPCDEGCPSCVHDLGCSQYNFVIDKAAGVLLLQDALSVMSKTRQSA